MYEKKIIFPIFILTFQSRMARGQRPELISELVKKLSREEMDLVIEHISHRVVNDDLTPGPSTEVTIDMVRDLVESGRRGGGQW